ncbi:YjbH domain-containing protein [Aliidiomarina celeris]|uniref:YjbH domain-containing protein n=1 Tax=Aliidiomarina celeris TaxID=2249428 RepID=UPI000DE8F41F|nr:YjbH domain-containing protein [Aliidiomarina celeris]
MGINKKELRSWVALAFLALAASCFSVAQAQENRSSTERSYNTVRVVVNDTFTMEFNANVRMSEVLNTALDQWEGELGLQPLDIYWPNARLAMVAGEGSEHQALEANRDAVIEELMALADHFLVRGERERAAQAASLVQQLSNILVAWQPFGVPQLGASRLFLEDNPQLPLGVYHLTLPARDPHFYVYGLTRSHGKQRIYSQQTVRGYLFAHESNGVLWPDANTSTAHYIAPAEAPIEVPWGMHNARARHMMPGDLLIVGFNEPKLPRKFRGINQRVAAVFEHFWLDPSAELMDNRVEATAERRIPDVLHWERLDLSPSRSNYGSIGLIQTPTARMAPEGELTLSYSDMQEYRRYNAHLQAFPWLEVGGFYTRVPSARYSAFPGFSGDNIYTDKGFDLKVRILKESEWRPELSVGLRDFAGTGLFSDEYVAASKRWGPLDFTLGVGFGRLGTRDSFINPFCEVSDRYCDRNYDSSDFSGRGGIPETEKWFTGPAAIFGGVEYQTPFPGLRLKLELEGNDYSQEFAKVDMTPSSPVNLGMFYRVNDWLDLQFAVERGDTFTFGITLRTNVNELSQIKLERDKTPPTPPRAESLADVRWNTMTRNMRRQNAYGSNRYTVTEDEQGEVVTAFVNPVRYRDNNEALDRAFRVMAAELPESVHTYEIAHQELFIPMVSTKVNAERFRAYIRNQVPGKRPEDAVETFERVEPAPRPDWDDPSWVANQPYRFSPNFAFQPFLDQDLGAPESFQFYQLGLKGSASHWLTEKLWLRAEVGLNIANNFDEFNFTVDAFDFLPLPRVRTYVREYMLNDLWIDSFQASYFHQFSDSVYGLAYAGLFERMYGGVGGEVLWRPLDSPFAFGVDLNYAKQRDFNGGFGFRDYNVVTGFATMYYQMPWLEDSMLQVGVGRFLAKDTGVALQAQRRFKSGVIIGAFANLTNVSSAEYGEGSFTKGVFISIPFDLMSVLPTRDRVSVTWVPLSRDGGQPLHRKIGLYPATDVRAPFYNR